MIIFKDNKRDKDTDEISIEDFNKKFNLNISQDMIDNSDKPLLFYKINEYDICIITGKKFVKKEEKEFIPKVNTPNLTTVVYINGIKCLVEFDRGYTILDVFKISNDRLRPAYYIDRGFVKINGKLIKLKNFSEFIRDNYVPDKILTYKEEKGLN